ncbi:MAG: GNAT family N-acetyltransferase [Actinobacteria bacterium]|nr:GNAT family N-acetyltransferase [Actinomycetota bacterium]MCB8996397.1 GNAT family N-acetyltransferase [Actinomycetota bacterium]HRY09799.1 GNAT family N-acetyltransferase [Candidatus Nanopelagicales bacterium]
MIRDTIDFALGILRPLRPDDAEDLVRACNDPSIARWTQVPVPYALSDAREFIGSHAGEDHAWVIDVDGLAGVIGVRGTMATLPGPVTEVGYWVAAWARGRGVATAALVAVRDELAQAGYQRIDWAAVAGNEASVQVARKAGFAIEGQRRQGLVHRGRLVDCVVGGWTASRDVPELVAGQWQVQPVGPQEVLPDLRPLASSALAVWVPRTAVGGNDCGYVMAVRSVAGVHLVAIDAPDEATAAARRYLQAQGCHITEDPLPSGWL